MTSEGPPSSGAQRSSRLPRLHPTAFTIAIVALVLSTLGLLVSIVQTNIAREDAKAARDTSTKMVEGLARKVFLDAGFDAVTVSNIGTLPIHDVTLYRTDARGKPTAVYEFERSLPGCSALRWDGPVREHLAVGFRVVNEGLWLLSDLTGLHRESSVPISVVQSPQQWSLTTSSIVLCS
ncbi:hypothetical protein [Marmoricola sp. URHB0036]|uniref:hypothetical protein n=1 Tax=Marmoricola sp. URHB0036 TaxID=1298863 RepID=UPI000487C06E|nr:hypothetical protein [Marmoricola sp. URHB0036]